MEEMVQLFPGVRVPKYIADWVRLMPWGDSVDSIDSIATRTKDFYSNPKKSVKNILSIYWDIDLDVNQILMYFGLLEKEERNNFLEGFNGDYNYRLNIVNSAFHLAKSLGLTTDKYSRQEQRDTFNAIAYFIHKEDVQFKDTGIEQMSDISLDYLRIENTISLVPTITLDKIVLESERFLPSYQIGQELKLETGYIIHRN